MHRRSGQIEIGETGDRVMEGRGEESPNTIATTSVDMDCREREREKASKR
jgi:hypothetical protein